MKRDIDTLHHDPSNAHIEAFNVGRYSMNLQFWGTTTDTRPRLIKWYVNGERKYPQDEIPSGGLGSNGITVGNLTSGAVQKVKADVYWNNGSFINSWTRTVYTRPENWRWSQKARNAFEGPGGPGRLTTNLTVVEWNDFVNRLIGFSRWNSNGSENINYGGLTLHDCILYIPGNNKLTAQVFNRVRYAVGSIASTGMSDKNRGDQVMGWYFTKFETCLSQAYLSEDDLKRINSKDIMTREEAEKMYEKLFDKIDQQEKEVELEKLKSLQRLEEVRLYNEKNWHGI